MIKASIKLETLMAATMDDISGWIARGKSDGQDFLIVMCDTYDYDDYPVFVKGTQSDCQKEYLKRRDGGNMQTVMEVYDLNADVAPQLSQRRAFPPWLAR